ncbi:pyridoxal phosphate-dependent aminotransferase [Brevibacillus laterosporus]|uniref:Aminotransferase n=1 Tax=Brevibacillus laterosporus TaxID=1465 RepID=A0AAP8QCQ5_BRELA|nr:aminotransferase class I/II-fold pyridoxal phosphate-dependent enzyme [Brevibacillus laterosporus]MED1665015.1 aminotransferase class I/II-fold pyridoxal phosphate-dependent enzyme [Brevibacillus laterosporus]MED1668774.1 aminotransferase class I/II-fold pyridoxal phosphate-dependent enzyme [Brevibacillus laterosporus]MED1716349.1 aminotransferase class I/II-fold pyridoxal phosphate-dependent enzyme [Brevibacillus laterosporus]PPA88514.1 aspartate aminotransferase [Brevibacillus laterosporus
MAKTYIQTLPEDAFSFIEEQLQRQTRPVISLAIGNPDGPPNPELVEKLKEYISNPSYHGYGDFTPDVGKKLKKAVASYYARRFGVSLCDETEVLDVLGTKEGIYYLLSSLLDEGDSVLVPSPSYSVYTNCLHLVGGVPIYFPCEKETFLPDLSQISKEDLQKAKVMVLCSPGNPTATVLSKDFLAEAIALAKEFNFVIIHDLAYAEISYDGVEVPSILSLPGGRDVAVELYSLSKSCNVAGWRIGFALGNKNVLQGLRTMKFNVDFGMFLPFQCVAIDALDHMEYYASEQTKRYQERMDYFVPELQKLGWEVQKSPASFFLWTKIPSEYEEMGDRNFVSYLLDQAGILLSPGSGFGAGGAGYVRIALVKDMEVLQEVIARLQKMKVSVAT